MTVFIFCEPDINCYNQTFPSAQMVTDHEERTIRVTDRPKVFGANETCLIANHHSQFLQILILISIKNVLESILGFFRNVSWIDVFLRQNFLVCVNNDHHSYCQGMVLSVYSLNTLDIIGWDLSHSWRSGLAKFA